MSHETLEQNTPESRLRAQREPHLKLFNGRDFKEVMRLKNRNVTSYVLDEPLKSLRIVVTPRGLSLGSTQIGELLPKYAAGTVDGYISLLYYKETQQITIISTPRSDDPNIARNRPSLMLFEIQEDSQLRCSYAGSMEEDIFDVVFGDVKSQLTKNPTAVLTNTRDSGQWEISLK